MDVILIPILLFVLSAIFSYLTQDPAFDVGCIIFQFFALFVVSVQFFMLPATGPVLGFVAWIILAFPFIIWQLNLQDRESREGRTRHWAVKLLISTAQTAVAMSPTLYTFIESQWRFREYSTTQELTVTKMPVARVCENCPLFTLISDTHITDHRETLEHCRDGPQKLGATLDFVRKQLRPRFCIVSGDLTDRGEQAEWDLFEKILHQTSPQKDVNAMLAVTFLMAPGNHDLQGSPFTEDANVLMRGLGHTYDAHASEIDYLARQERVLTFAQKEEGDLGSVGTLTLRNTPFFTKLIAVRDDVAKARIEQIPEGSAAPRWSMRLYQVVYPPGSWYRLSDALNAFDDLFPLIYEDSTASVAVVLMNSSAIPSPGASMGLGEITSPQTDRLGRYLAQVESKFRTLVVVIHHAPARREHDEWSWTQFLRLRTNSDIWAHTFLALEPRDARKFMSVIDSFAAAHTNVQVVVAHGHRHGPAYLGRTARGVWLLEAPAVIEEQNPGAWAVYRSAKGLEFKWEYLQDMAAPSVRGKCRR
jgi:3',5'-cyclic AMP phosphodiesterase CpdA